MIDQVCMWRVLFIKIEFFYYYFCRCIHVRMYCYILSNLVVLVLVLMMDVCTLVMADLLPLVLVLVYIGVGWYIRLVRATTSQSTVHLICVWCDVVVCPSGCMLLLPPSRSPRPLPAAAARSPLAWAHKHLLYYNVHCIVPLCIIHLFYHILFTFNRIQINNIHSMQSVFENVKYNSRNICLAL